MKKMYEYINYIEPIKSNEELEKDFIVDYSKVSRTKVARIESGMHSPTVKNLIQILGPIGYTIKIEKIKKKS